MKCDIIIPIWNQKDVTRDCIDSIVKNTDYPYRLILIDNASEQDTRSYLESIRDNKALDVKLVHNIENLGFVKAVNQGLKISDAPYVCIMNNDTVATAGWLSELVNFAEEHKDAGIMNPLCGRPKGTLMDEYAVSIKKYNRGKFMEMNQCFFFCALIKREVIDKIGYLDEVFGMGCYDDTDYSMRAGLAGYRCISVHTSYVEHRHGTSFSALGNKKEIAAKCEKEYLKKWPRHLRVGMTFSLSDKVKDADIARMLESILFLAREWCWINLWVFGDPERSRKRIESASRGIRMPVHQNIKLNYFPGHFIYAQALVRLLERSFGTKRRKRYDLVLSDNEPLSRFLKIFGLLHNNRVEHFSPADNNIPGEMRLILSELRRRKSA